MSFIRHDILDIRDIRKVVLMMAIQERKLRKIGNSVVVTLSKEFLGEYTDASEIRYCLR